MGIFTRVKNKFKYDNKLRLFLDGLSKLGIRISPHILYVESAAFSPGYSEVNAEKFKDYTISFLNTDEIEEIAKIDRPGVNRTKLLQRIKEGNACLGIKENGTLAAFTWYNLKEAKWFDRPLQDDEAYLFDMYTLNEFRGRGLASFIRFKIYEELQKLGRTRCFSYSALYNHSSIRFKEKLNSKKEYLILNITLFRLWETQIKLKDYNEK